MTRSLISLGLLVSSAACRSFAVGQADDGEGGATSTQAQATQASGDGSAVAASVSDAGSSSAGDSASSSTGVAPPTDPLPQFLVEACPDADTWETACITFENSMLVGVDVSGGVSCLLSDSVFSLVRPNGLAVIGDTVVTCDELLQRVVRYEVSTGTMETNGFPCVSLAAANDALYILQDSGAVVRAPSYEELTASGVQTTNIASSATRLGGHGGMLYAMSSVGGELERWELATELPLQPLALGKLDDYIAGITADVTGRIFVLSAGSLSVFSDLGTPLLQVPLMDQIAAPRGLRCYRQTP